MTTVPVSKLKASWRAILARVKNGEELILTERGRPVARIVPCGGPDKELLELERAGLVRCGSGRLPKRFWKMRRPKDPKGLVLLALLGERRMGR